MSTISIGRVWFCIPSGVISISISGWLMRAIVWWPRSFPSTDWLTDSLSGWLDGWVIAWVNWLTDWVADWLTDWLSEWPNSLVRTASCEQPPANSLLRTALKSGWNLGEVWLNRGEVGLKSRWSCGEVALKQSEVWPDRGEVGALRRIHFCTTLSTHYYYVY